MTKGKLYNKIEDNFHLNNKKALYLNMKNYYEALDEDVFANLPLTFHVKAGLDDPEFTKFKNQYYNFEDEIKDRKVA
jgi:predicted GNAT superfamily acetyltransferase